MLVFRVPVEAVDTLFPSRTAFIVRTRLRSVVAAKILTGDVTVASSPGEQMVTDGESEFRGQGEKTGRLKKKFRSVSKPSATVSVFGSLSGPGAETETW